MVVVITGRAKRTSGVHLTSNRAKRASWTLLAFSFTFLILICSDFAQCATLIGRAADNETVTAGLTVNAFRRRVSTGCSTPCSSRARRARCLATAGPESRRTWMTKRGAGGIDGQCGRAEVGRSASRAYAARGLSIIAERMLTERAMWRTLSGRR